MKHYKAVVSKEFVALQRNVAMHAQCRPTFFGPIGLRELFLRFPIVAVSEGRI